MRNNPAKHHLKPFETSGILLVDKPKDWTSFDVVNCVRARFNIPKVGHCGTLDPAATGLLVLVFGRFTRLSQSLSGSDKTYRARLLLGTTTDSGDLDGEVLSTCDPSAVTEAQLRETLAGFVGEQMQVPPMVSAVKHDGKKLYELARKGIEVEREPRPITIYSLEPETIALPECEFVVKCSKGTYVRTLCEDIGKKLGVGGVLAGLRRLRCGVFDLQDAVTMDTIKSWEQADLEIRVRTYLAERAAELANAAAGEGK